MIRNDSLTVRPLKCSSTPGRDGSGNSRGKEVERQCHKDEDKANKNVMSFEEDSEEALRPKGVMAPSSPSRQERLEHDLTHLPFRSWCEFCVKGKCKADQHRATGQLAESEVPVVSFDYAFMGDKSKSSDKGEDEGTELEDGRKEEAADNEVMKILVGRDAKSRVCSAIPVPQKGLDPTEWSVRESLRFLKFLGYTSVVLKTDQESALRVVMDKLRTHRGDQTQTMSELSPVGDSKSNGLIERTIQTVEGQVRTMRCALEARISRKLVPGGALFSWLVIHAANVINLFEVGKDGKVPYQRLRGRKLHPDLIEFGECVHYLPLNHLELGKAEARWKDGIFLGLRLESGEKLVGTHEGVFKVRSIRRKVESERWDAKQHDMLTCLPWKPYSSTDDDAILVKPPIPSTVELPMGESRQVRRDEDRVPRSFTIQKRDLVNFGYTPACMGCYAAANDRRYKPHTVECRLRIEKAMLEDESGSNRVKEAKLREDSYLEEQVRRADEDRRKEEQVVHRESQEGGVPIQTEAATPPTPRNEPNDNSMSNEPDTNSQEVPMTWEETLEEQNFHDIVNTDDQMYKDIDDVPMDSEDIAGQMIGIINSHVSEVWSQPRVTKLASEYGLTPGSAYDIEINDEDGKPWDFDLPSQRAKCLQQIQEQKPEFLIGSPMCTAFSILQGLNKWRMSPDKWNSLIEKGLRHMRFAVKLYRLQDEGGRFFLHEHPNSATSWKMPEVLKLMNDLQLEKTTAHMCRYGMKSADESGGGRVKKPTGFLTNSSFLRDQLGKRCMGGHHHIQLLGGRARACQVYPDKLCRAILVGIRNELVNTGKIKANSMDMLNVSQENLDPEEYFDEYVDDVSGQPLVRELVQSARKEEMVEFEQHGVYTKVPISECIRVTGKRPIGSKWIDINKGDVSNPNYRSRLVAKEIKRGPSDDMFAATPPLEAKKSLFSMAMTQFARGRAQGVRGTQKLLFVDVRRAYFYAPARRPVFVTLPDEDAEEGMCGRLNRSMYGTRDAAANWEDKYSSHLVAQGFIRGRSSPCTFFHPARGIRCVVHGDDFTFLGCEDDLKWCTQMMKDEYEIKLRGMLGPDKHDDKKMTILNRCIEWRKNEIWYEADPRHAEILIRELGLKGKRAVVTPGVKMAINEEDDKHLDPSAATRYRQLIARCNFVAQDRPDVQYAVKEAAKGMSSPKKLDWEKLVRIGQYLAGRPRYVLRYVAQKDVCSINAFGDSDFAGDVVSRKSTSGGLVCLGDHVVKSWSSSQSIIALSTGEAELYALNKASATAIGLKSLLDDLGVHLEIKVFTDATTGKAMAVRRGLGKVRHIAVNELWIQERVHLGDLRIIKIKNKFNPADLMTKHLSQAEIVQILEHLNHLHAEGRSDNAPELALVHGDAEDDEERKLGKLKTKSGEEEDLQRGRAAEGSERLCTDGSERINLVLYISSLGGVLDHQTL